MSLDTTKEQFRNKHFRTIYRIIVENFGTSIQSENTKVVDFLEQEYQVIEFELLLHDKFDLKFNLETNPNISDILDQICQA